MIYRALKPNPRSAQNFVAMDPLEWLLLVYAALNVAASLGSACASARMSDHIPDPGKHRTLSYGHYANRVRGERAAKEPGTEAPQDKPAKKRRAGASWARLISKVFHVDPLRCRGCGGPLQIVAYITDHLGLSPPEEPHPPPEVLYVPIDDEGRELPAMVAE